MFNGAQNVVVEDGSFVVNVDASKITILSEVDIGPLIELVAPNAILNAGGRADEVRCYPGTREEVIGKIETWMNNVRDGSCKNRIMWLSGPAGAGKSAICQTVAERCATRRQQAANFFFFRGDQTRNRAQPLVPTLVYQLRDSYPMLDELLTDCLKAHPLIGKASIGDQFQHMISFPMQTVRQNSSGAHGTILLIVDGLDECDDSRKQDDILIALHALADAHSSPFLVLVASRAEPQLIMSFNQLGTSVESIFLNDEYRPRDDIHLFVTAKFDEIKRVHHLRELLSEDWPAKSVIDAITDKSSGQFIYAATVMRFIQYSSESPNLSLVAILKMLPPPGHKPFAQLDAVYSFIFSKVRDIQSVKLLLCANSIADAKSGFTENYYQDFFSLIGYGLVETKSLFSDLGAIIQVNADPLRLVFYHASLHDYLKDQHRSMNYHLDVGEISADLSAICLRNFHDKRSFDIAIQPFRYVRKTTTELSKSLVDATTRTLSDPLAPESIYNWTAFMIQLEKLYLETDRELFKILLRGWVCFSHTNNIASGRDIGLKSSAAAWYYKWYRVTEALKLTVKRS